MSDRAERLAALLRSAEVDVLLVTKLVNVRYLTGFTGSNGLAAGRPATRDCSSPTSATSSRPRRRSTRALSDRRNQLESVRRPDRASCPPVRSADRL